MYATLVQISWILSDNGCEDAHWLPAFFVAGIGLGEDRSWQWFNCAHRLCTFLRLSYCAEVCFNLERLQSISDAADDDDDEFHFVRLYNMLVEDLNAEDTAVGFMRVVMVMDDGCKFAVQRGKCSVAKLMSELSEHFAVQA